MSKKDDALKLALEGAANYIDALGGDSRTYRQALAEQPAQQPAQQPICGLDVYLDPNDGLKPKLFPKKPAQPSKPWVGLTDEERGQVYASWRFNGSNSSNLELCRAIEAKLREKNA